MQSEGEKLERLLQVGRDLIAELDPETVLERILSEARVITGARFAALGVLDESRTELERFVTSGLDEEQRRTIGELPRGRGVLGVLILEQRPLRLTDVGQHPESYGFPPGHPPMRSFLGVPIMVRGQSWGNLYLTEKHGGEFTAEDEQAVVALAAWAGIAIENARVHDASERRRDQLERAVRALEASRAIAEAMGSVDDLERVLELIVKRGRALVEARTLLILLREGEELTVAACAGRVHDARGRRVAITGSTSGEVLLAGRPRRLIDARELRVAPEQLGVAGAHTALLVPLLHRGEAIGVLAAFDHAGDAKRFSTEDEALLIAFAQSAANAVAIKRSVEADRLRAAIDAADSERARWARELHDQTLQALGGLRVLLSASLARDAADARETAVRQAIGEIELEISNLREIISDLRPALLDDLGLHAAIEALLERRRYEELEIESELAELGTAGANGALAPTLETAVYRIVQEALTNVVKHAHATTVRVGVRREAREIVVEVADDGVGFDVGARTGGFGLSGIRERVALAGGALEIDSSPKGTRLITRLPAAARSETEPDPSADQLVG